MPIVAFGLSHRTAGVDLRGRAAILPKDLKSALDALLKSASFVREAIILSTCNRTEILANLAEESQYIVELHLRCWLADYCNLATSELKQTTYCHWNDDAIDHIIRVASGLDSQVLGEPQILGQFKDAVDIAGTSGSMHDGLSAVVNAAIKTSKTIRTETELGRHSVSLPQAALILARQIFSDLVETRVLLLGAGDTISLVSSHFKSAGIQRIDVANRTLSHARSIAKQVNGSAFHLWDIGDRLQHYDIVVSSTSSPTTVVSKNIVEEASKHRRYKPIFLVDLAVPRDIDPTVSLLSNVYLYTIDDLTSVIDDNLQLREVAANGAQTYVQQGRIEYHQQQSSRQLSGVIANFRENVACLRDSEISKALARLKAGDDPTEVVERLGGDLANKLAHEPTMALKRANQLQDHKALELLCDAFAGRK